MIRPWSSLVRHSAYASLSLALFGGFLVACTDEPSSPTTVGLNAPRETRTATTGITVSAASPDSATRDTTLDVTISGSGFASDAVATWALHGTPDATQVRTNSTRYVNPNKVIANITISSTATIASWDVIIYSGKKSDIGSDAFAIKPSTPSDTWKLPLADAGLSFKSDRQFSDGTSSVYAAGVCNVTGAIFSGDDGGTNNGGDATLQVSLPTHGQCGRQFTIAYPDGVSETLAAFSNLHALENTVYSIPIGSTAFRRLTINTVNVVNKVNPRCDKLQFGAFPTGGAGSDSVAVTRIDASTWQVKSQAPPNDHALCEKNGQLYHMQVSFIAVSSRPLR
jgi:hypothetical protein